MQVLQTRHLVLLASMREGWCARRSSSRSPRFPPRCATWPPDRYVQERREILAALGSLGILTLDSTAAEFPVALANRYNDIKAAGRI
jgi:hypothetical protein